MKRATDEPGHHKFSLLMVIAALLLMISAALLLTRLKLKPDFDILPPAAEQTIPAPAAEAPPLPDTSIPTDVFPAPEGEAAPPAASAPGATPESDAPAAAPDAPHAISPSANPADRVGPPPIRLGETQDEAEVQPVSLSSDGGRSLPPGVGMMVIEPN
jgi:hypothetical protein